MATEGVISDTKSEEEKPDSFTAHIATERKENFVIYVVDINRIIS
jgi:hypothetical protein